MPTNNHRGGRPTIYSQELADEICEQLSLGKSLRKVCGTTRMPAIRTVFYWFRTNEEFLHQYMRAKEEAADAMADDVLYLSDSVKRDKDAINKARLQVDTRKWLMSKMKPKKYGDRLDLNNSGEIVHKWSKLDDEELERALKARENRVS